MPTIESIVTNDVVDWQNKDTVVEPPFIELTDDEETDINEDDNDEVDSNKRPSTNPGNQFFFHIITFLHI